MNNTEKPKKQIGKRGKKIAYGMIVALMVVGAAIAIFTLGDLKMSDFEDKNVEMKFAPVDVKHLCNKAEMPTANAKCINGEWVSEP